MEYVIKLKMQSPIKLMSIRDFTNINTIGMDIGKIFQEVFSYVSENNGKFTGECVAIYHDKEFDPNKIDVEGGFGVAEYIDENDRVKKSQIQERLVVSTIHKGPYEKLENAYMAIMKWIEDNGYEWDGPMYDIYLNNPEELEGKEDDALTETIWPIKKK